MNKSEWNFVNLVNTIQDTHTKLALRAHRAINISLTARNWLIGYYISEYEIKSEDRAVYGEKLLTELSQKLEQLKISNCKRRQLYDYINFYRNYPQFLPTLSAQFNNSFQFLSIKVEEKVPTVSAQSYVSPDKL